MKKLYLLRGLPGAGKSTLAEELSNSIFAPAFEADQYFMINGKYEFDASKLKLAHEWCLNQVDRSMFDSWGTIIVSNTFTTESEMEPYFELAKKYNYTVFSIIVENRNDTKSIHNVPIETIDKMENRFQIKLR